MKKYYFRKHLMGGYAYTLKTNNGVFVSVSFDTPLDALKSLRSKL